ncbi:alpha/beta fold hydrolase [Streptomyces sp. NPDC007808]|uniref:alpha/beta fold hydrolase n=1 Tax=Streptomyces sp. NPDC007808 TaxID=3364779 RepID=UPI0036D02579
MSIARKIASAFLGPIPVSRGRALGTSERLAAATALTSSLEYLSQRRQIRKGGFNDWSVARRAHADSSPVTRKLLDLVSGERTTTALHMARVAVSAGLLLPGDSRLRGAGSLFLGATALALYPRHRYGTDGSDQVSTLVQTAMGAARLSRSPTTQDALMWYVALQGNLSYVVAGWAKLLGTSWRDGTALGGIMRTRTYGHGPTYALTQKHPRAAKYLTHGVLALECLFPVAYLAGGRLAKPVIGAAAGFHLANGFVMGLGRFVTAFVAMHPAIAYTSAPKDHPSVAGRDDRVLKTAAVVFASAVSAAGAVAVHRRLRAIEGWPRSLRATTRHGNELQYEMNPGEPDRPVLVFATGMLSTSEHFGWITDTIRHDGRFGFLTYARAGYAGSRYRSKAPYRLAEAVDDLVDLVGAAVPADRDVVLVGHSLGGELARRAAARLGERVRAVVYLDSSHPGELNRSQQQSASAKPLGASLSLMVWSLRCGAGVLLARPGWLEALPAMFRKRVFDQYADARMWVAGHREWKAVESEFRAHTGELAAVTSHALVVSAQRTVDKDPEHLLMHHEIADAHRGAGRTVETVVLEGADHDSLLTDGRYGVEVGRLLLDFVTRTAEPAKTSERKEQTA